MQTTLWKRCLDRLEEELSAQQFNTWIRPLHAVEDGRAERLLAPNRFVQEWVKSRFFERIGELVGEYGGGNLGVSIEVGSQTATQKPLTVIQTGGAAPVRRPSIVGRFNPEFTFETHVEGKSNQLARAAARQIGENPGGAYNPLFIYGGVGLGKPHPRHAAGNLMLKHRPDANIAYVHSERFVADMVKAFQHNAINEFKKIYRGLDALLIDDIQFFIGKERSQEEFFHTFNALLEGQRQVIITADRFPKDVAFFIAKRVRSNVRELEGALRRILASAYFTGRAIDISLVSDSLKDLLSFQERLMTINSIQKTVAEYYKIRISDLHSKSRVRQVARPRQVAMTLAKELTEHSLPEIGEAFGGRDHTTVLHACRKVKELSGKDARVKEDFDNLMRLLTT